MPINAFKNKTSMMVLQEQPPADVVAVVEAKPKKPFLKRGEGKRAQPPSGIIKKTKSLTRYTPMDSSSSGDAAAPSADVTAGTASSSSSDSNNLPESCDQTADAEAEAQMPIEAPTEVRAN